MYNRRGLGRKRREVTKTEKKSNLSFGRSGCALTPGVAGVLACRQGEKLQGRKTVDQPVEEIRTR